MQPFSPVETIRQCRHLRSSREVATEAGPVPFFSLGTSSLCSSSAFFFPFSVNLVRSSWPESGGQRGESIVIIIMCWKCMSASVIYLRTDFAWLIYLFLQLFPERSTSLLGNRWTRGRCPSGTTRPKWASSSTGACIRCPPSALSGSGKTGKVMGFSWA